MYTVVALENDKEFCAFVDDGTEGKIGVSLDSTIHMDCFLAYVTVAQAHEIAAAVLKAIVAAEGVAK